MVNSKYSSEEELAHRQLRNKQILLFKKWEKYIMSLLTVFILVLFLLLAIFQFDHRLERTHIPTAKVPEIDFKRDNNIPRSSGASQEERKVITHSLKTSSQEISTYFHIFGAGQSCTRNDGTEFVEITCSNQNSIQAVVEDINKNFKIKDKVTLTMFFMDFLDKTLTMGWLEKLDIRIYGLALRRSINLEKLGDAAFSGKPFKDLNYLTIEQSDIQFFRKETFGGGILLNTMEIRNIQPKPVKFEADVFQHIKHSLATLQIQNCIDDYEALSNITGSNASSFGNLITIDFRQNNIEKLTRDSFSSIPKVQTIYLDSCNIETIEVYTFSHLRDLRTLSLTNNLLTHLPEGVFGKNIAKVSLQNNNWICDCYLNWLKVVYVTGNVLQKPLYCDDKEFDQTDFCPPTSTETTSSTQTTSTTDRSGTSDMSSTYPSTTVSSTTGLSTEGASTSSTKTSATKLTTQSISTPSTKSSATKPTTKPPKKSSTAPSSSSTRQSSTDHPTSTTKVPLIEVECRKTVNLENFDFTRAHSVSLRDGKINFMFYNSNVDRAEYSISIIGIPPDDWNLLVRDVDTKIIECHDMTSSSFALSLINGKTYSLCLLEDNHQEVSPYDCTALSVPLKTDQQSWITNQQKTNVVIGISCSVLVLILVTAITVFFCIRQHPTLIKGNKRVILVKNKTAEALVMPKNYGCQHYAPPSGVRSISTGYLTPRAAHSYYEMPRTPLSRRSSSYITHPSPKMTRRHSLTKRRSSFHNCDEVYEIPPPLPPNHPLESRIAYKETMPRSQYRRGIYLKHEM